MFTRCAGKIHIFAHTAEYVGDLDVLPLAYREHAFATARCRSMLGAALHERDSLRYLENRRKILAAAVRFYLPRSFAPPRDAFFCVDI